MITATKFQSNLINLQESLIRFAKSLTGDEDEAKDLVQDTYLKALRYSDKFVDDSNFRAWTLTIMRNTFINGYRRNTLQNGYKDYLKLSFCNNNSEPLTSGDPESYYSANEIVHNIEELNDTFRIPLKMHIHGYKYKEIADELNLNIGTVKSRIHLSRKKLRDRLNS